MQKKFIALTVAGLVSGAAFAQSNVTIYGIADGSFDVVRVSGQSGPAQFANTNRVSANSSYIGFKGSEALGNGLTAVFQFENTVAFDSAAAITGNRDSFVGLAGGFGTVVLGTLTGPTRALGAALDVNSGATGIGANTAILGKLGGVLTNVTTDANGNVGQAATSVSPNRSTTQASTFDTRWKNTIAYVSPTFGGFNGVAAYVANENHSNTVNTSGYDLGLNYNNGPIMAGLTYNGVNVNNNAGALGLGSNIKLSETRLGGAYTFSVASIRALWARTSAKTDTNNQDFKQNTWGLGGTYNVTAAGKVVAQYYRANNIGGSMAGDTSGKLWELGYEHSLSKRTILKAVYANVNNGSGASYDFGVNATGASATQLNNNTVSGIQLGLRHAF